MSKLIEDYNKAEQVVYDHLGVKTGYPIYDYTKYYWAVGLSKEVIWAETYNNLVHGVEDEGYTDVDLDLYPKDGKGDWWKTEEVGNIYRGEELMGVEDWYNGREQVLMVFDNSKEILIDQFYSE